MEEKKEKQSFGTTFSMAIGASLAIAVLTTLKIGGMLFTGVFVALASLLGLGLYRLFFSEFKLSNIFLILFSTGIIVFLLFSVKSPNQSVLSDYPAPEPSPTQKPVSAGDSLAKMMEKFNEKQAELVRIPEKKSPVKNPYLKEKVVFYTKGINFGQTDAKWIFDSGPANLANSIAETPEDVKTVVLKVCTQIKSETPYFIYLNNDRKNKKEISVFYWNCDLTIIDRTISAVVYQKTFDSKPFNTLVFDYDSTDKYETPMPDFAIELFLKKIPVK